MSLCLLGGWDAEETFVKLGNIKGITVKKKKY
jgi:hypothetical protein